MNEESGLKTPEPIAAQLVKVARANIAPDEFLKRFFQLVQAALRAEAGSLWFYDSENRQLVRKIATGFESGPLGEIADEPLTRIVYRSIEQKMPVLYSPGESAESETLRNVSLIAVPVEIDEKVSTVVLLARRKRDDALYTREDVYTLQGLCVYCLVYFGNYRSRQSVDISQRLAKLAEVESELAGTLELEKMAFILANRARGMMFFDRTFVALPQRTGFSVAAVSGVGDIPQKGAVVANLKDLVREVVRIGGDWHFTPGYLEKVEDERLREKLAIYFETTDYKSILLMRIEDDEGLLGVMGFERREEGSYDAAGFKFLQGFCKASSRALRRAGQFERLPGISLVRKAQNIRERALGPRRVRFFIKSALMAAAILLLVFGKWDLRVKGDCRITPYLTTRAVAAQSGTVVEILKTERDSVKKGETIALLDDRDIVNAIRETVLKIDLQKARINALAATDPPAANLARMQLKILQIQLDRQNIQKDMLRIKSPTNGIIITPREVINTSLNAAIRAGEPFCEIADTSKLYLEVQINDRDIGLVKPGQEIDFRLAGAPNVPLSCRVLDISPSTRPMPGKNIFVVRGLLEDANKERGLMHFLNLTGSAAISTGKRPLLYIIFRSTLERLRVIFL